MRSARAPLSRHAAGSKGVDDSEEFVIDGSARLTSYFRAAPPKTGDVGVAMGNDSHEAFS